MDCNKLRGEIVAKFRTQSAFARAIGWHRNKISKLVLGEYKPDTDEVAAIADVLSLNQDEFCSIFLPKTSPNGDV